MFSHLTPENMELIISNQQRFRTEPTAAGICEAGELADAETWRKKDPKGAGESTAEKR